MTANCQPYRKSICLTVVGHSKYRMLLIKYTTDVYLHFLLTAMKSIHSRIHALKRGYAFLVVTKTASTHTVFSLLWNHQNFCHTVCWSMYSTLTSGVFHIDLIETDRNWGEWLRFGVAYAEFGEVTFHILHSFHSRGILRPAVWLKALIVGTWAVAGSLVNPSRVGRWNKSVTSEWFGRPARPKYGILTGWRTDSIRLSGGRPAAAPYCCSRRLPAAWWPLHNLDAAGAACVISVYAICCQCFWKKKLTLLIDRQEKRPVGKQNSDTLA